MFSIGTQEEEPGDELRGNIKRRLQGQRFLTKVTSSQSSLFSSVSPLDIEQAEASLVPYRLNSIRPYRSHTSLAFFAAVKEQNYKLVRHLIGESRQLVTDQDSLGLTALHWAVKRDDSKMLDLLVRWGADVNQTDMLNRTPLYLAMKQGSVKLVTALVDLGADPTIATVAGVSPQQIPKEGTPLWMVLFKREYVSA
jgi:ankyrin repeat protein